MKIQENKKIFNFSAGPAMLPIEVLKLAQEELCNWHGSGKSIMEISHRSKEFLEVAYTSEHDLRELLMIPENYKVLFCHGGARTHFAAIPMNLLGSATSANYVNSGYWTQFAIQEAKKYCIPHVINIIVNDNGFITVKPLYHWNLLPNNIAPYLHYCPNETIDGLAIHQSLDFTDTVIVGDLSSVLLSQPLDVTNFGVIYASAQKNIGPAGLTLVIIREDLLERTGYLYDVLPSVLNYTILSKNKSMFNTPPTFAWYIAGLVFKWIKLQGGLIEIEKRNYVKANLLYQVIDENDFYYNKIDPLYRSRMNVIFNLTNTSLINCFLKQSLSYGLHALQGHRAVGGIRASLYNAMPLEGIQVLVEFMRYFAYRYG